MDDEARPTLSYLKLFLNDLKPVLAAYSPAQVDRYIRGLVEYLETGVRAELKNKVERAFYAQACDKIDDQCKAYARTVKTNRENGAAGGRAKAEKHAKRNSKKNSNASTGSTVNDIKHAVLFTPPTLEEVKATIDDLDAESYIPLITKAEIAQFYDALNESGWRIPGTDFTFADVGNGVLFDFLYDYFHTPNCGGSYTEKLGEYAHGCFIELLKATCHHKVFYINGLLYSANRFYDPYTKRFVFDEGYPFEKYRTVDECLRNLYDDNGNNKYNNMAKP